jgi:putative glutamine amidotransferase
MTEPPLILITGSIEQRGVEFADTSISLSDRYPRAIAAAGGLPWVLPCLPDERFVAEAVRRSHGVMLTGGDDIQPRLYGARTSPRLRKTVSRPQPARDVFELLLLQEVFRRRKPLLAICRGHQLLNVALGGTLYVDLLQQRPEGLNHNRPDHKDQPVHKVALTPGSLMHKIAGQRTLAVNSTHHQAVARLAPMLRPTAVSLDGLVEALELVEAEAEALPFLLSVQFHPERMWERYLEFRELFGRFTRACKTRRKLSI